MSGSLAVSRSVDDRRRRRLAVSGDGTATDTADAEAAVGLPNVARVRTTDTLSVSPWLPYSPWRRAAVLAGFWLTLLAFTIPMLQPGWLPEHSAQVLAPLTTGSSPKLAGLVDLVLWLLAAEFAALVGWYRSHSQLDFSGRYRTWGWIAMACAVGGLLSFTGLHQILAELYVDRLTVIRWRRDIFSWVIPWGALGLLTLWLIDRDIRRCTLALWTQRLSGILAGGLLALVVCAAELECEAWYRPALLGGRWLTLGLLVTAFWTQACYVAYVCPDPPIKSTSTWRLTAIPLFGWLIQRWWKPIEPVVEETPRRGRRKKAVEAEETDAAPVKRKRKTTAAKTRKTATRRTRTRAADSDESLATEDEAASDDWNASEEEAAENPAPESSWEDDELARLEELTRPEQTASPRHTPGPPPPKSAQFQAASTSQGYDDEDDDDEGGGGKSDQYKGLSKRQRRELKKQQRELERRTS